MVQKSFKQCATCKYIEEITLYLTKNIIDCKVKICNKNTNIISSIFWEDSNCICTHYKTKNNPTGAGGVSKYFY